MYEKIPMPEMKPSMRHILRNMPIGDASFVHPRSKQAQVHSNAAAIGIKLKTQKISETEIRVWRIA